MSETAMADRTAIDVSGLVKDYGRGRGVFGVSFSVTRGEVFGFLGPNGAGKTVTMRHLMGFIRADAGRASIQSMDCFAARPRIQARLGYLPGEISMMDEMSASGFLEFMARMKQLQDRRRLHELAELFELDLRARIRKMSKGTKQKVGLICALMGSPDVLLLDEPTSGLDPLMQQRFIDLVLAEKRRGATIMLSSHMFEEVDRTCDRVAFIRGGRLAAVERMDDVRRSRKRTLEVSFLDTATRERYLTAHPRTARTGETGASIEVIGEMDEFVKDLAGFGVADLTVREQPIEEFFMHLYGSDEIVEKENEHD
ncbi:ABC transporter related protein [Coriobacterium glomerans PW2]|uniref:ABC transporter related protein n=1 Tax=Coriobacterium glomerans (strain ATCC 49209 / DSM 20642 / JCM 10262 / PW2) TaxID=700015 RepID=F2NB12_CORGP|nr:ABC transporter ATP-binding protein [Coriobacterium glomerans]AEB07763.1 ABC transporter related protein [Coriobacterium glomerans PW2]